LTDADVAGQEGAPADEGDKDLGERLRYFRVKQGLTLREVAHRAAMSIGSLSQIERGLSSPSMRTLRSVCQALDIDGAALFAPSPESPEQRQEHSDFVVKANRRKPLRLKGTGVSKYRLTPSSCASMEAYLMEIEPGASSDPDFLVQTGDKIGYVLSGKLMLFVDEKSFLLDAGDTYGFPAGHVYRWQNGWNETTLFLVVNSNHFYV
jgi:transcriptional regulator with XRE-family HTH domain